MRMLGHTLSLGLLSLAALSSALAAPSSVVLTCAVAYMPQRSTWVREVRIDLDPQRLRAYGVTPADVSQALREHLQKWILEHWTHSLPFIASVLLITYSFALDKRIYAKALVERVTADGAHL